MMSRFEVGDVVKHYAEGVKGLVTERHGRFCRIAFVNGSMTLEVDELKPVSDEELFGVEIPEVGSEWIDSLGDRFTIVRVSKDLAIVRQYDDDKLTKASCKLTTFLGWIRSKTIRRVEK